MRRTKKNDALFVAASAPSAKGLSSQLLALKSFFPASYHKRFLKSLDRNLDLLLAYKRNPALPSNSNAIESWNRTLERKLKNMDGFQTDKSCKAFLKLWFNAHSMKESK
ncbi:hypothetical protein KAH81_01030 [bacterium]|nr:hypothetical protein [bacterium]